MHWQNLVYIHWLTVKEHLESLEQIDCWVSNVSVYTAAYTIRQYGGELKTTAPTQNKKKETLKWIKNIETSIENTRKFIGKLTACKKTNTFFKNHKCLKDMLEKQFGNTKLQTLEYKLEVYKQKLKASCTKLKYQKMLHQRKVINRQFSNNPRQVFRQMKRIALKVEGLPLKNDVVQFFSDIWGNKGNFNHNAEWLNLLETSYFPNVIKKDFILLGLILSRRPFKSYNSSSSPAHLFAIRGKRKRGPGTLQTRD